MDTERRKAERRVEWEKGRRITLLYAGKETTAVERDKKIATMRERKKERKIQTNKQTTHIQAHVARAKTVSTGGREGTNKIVCSK